MGAGRSATAPRAPQSFWAFAPCGWAWSRFYRGTRIRQNKYAAYETYVGNGG